MGAWITLLLSLLFPSYALWRFLRGPRYHPPLPPDGRCAYCDYDLTGNVSGVCPECGNQIE